MEARIARLKAAKKDKKSKKIEKTVTKDEVLVVQNEFKQPSSSSASTSTSSSSKIKLEAKNKQLILNKRALISDKLGDDPQCKKTKDAYSVAQDPKATEVYKSIFTSHDDEKQQDRAHWVTYNPFYI